jgi:uncharacterized membrane protein
MQRRLYFMLPDIETTHQVVEKLLNAQVEKDNMYVVARDDAQTHDLPEAGLTEKSDITGSAGRGVTAGGVTGVLAGLTAMVFPPAGIAIGGGVVAASALAGAGFGAWASSMIGISQDNPQVQNYETAIRDGQVLMMVDIDPARVDEIRAEVESVHPDVVIEGTEARQPTSK